MSNHFDFYCITGCTDLNEKIPLENIKINQWNIIQISPNKSINVWYDDKKHLNYFKFKKLIHAINPQVIYLNGFMSITFLLIPLLVIKTALFNKIKTVIAPRGMLQLGAINIKQFKKKYFLLFIQLLNLTKNIIWHVTDNVEIEGITKYFKAPSEKIFSIGNIPLQPPSIITSPNKTVGTLNLVYASIITDKKNLIYVIEALKCATTLINLNIYGVIKESSYWELCLNAINQLPINITVHFLGDFKSAQMHNIVSKHDAMILMSKGENFSHAIYECLSAGRPIISSEFTSWHNLSKHNAGWNFSNNNHADLANELDVLSYIDNDRWKIYCEGAHLHALNYLTSQSFRSDYYNLLNA